MNNDHINRFKSSFMMKSTSLNELCAISDSISLTDSYSSLTTSEGKISPVSIISSSPIDDRISPTSLMSSPSRSSYSNSNYVSPSRIYEAPARLSIPVTPLTKKRSLTLTDFNDDNFVHLESSSFASQDMIELVKSADAGIKAGVEPFLCDDAMGGTYFLRDKAKNAVLVCKPGDEELHSPHHPSRIKYRYGTAYKGRIVPGFSMFREVAAFILDGSFAGVPETALGKIRIKYNPLGEVSLNSSDDGTSTASSWSLHGYKLCSLQHYIRHECCTEDMGPGMFSTDDVHRIAILDIRICNLDRHQGNILVCKNHPYKASQTAAETVNDSSLSKSAPIECTLEKCAIENTMLKSQYKLVPIDHGYCLPHILAMNEANLSWISWPHSKLPLSLELREYIKNLDYQKDIQLLKQMMGVAMPDSSLITLQVCTTLLKKGIEEGLTLHDIGMIMINNNITDKNAISLLQEAVNEAIKNAYMYCQNSNRPVSSSFQSKTNKKSHNNSFPNIFKMDHETNNVANDDSTASIEKNLPSITLSCDAMLGYVIHDSILTIELNKSIEMLVKRHCAEEKK